MNDYNWIAARIAFLRSNNTLTDARLTLLLTMARDFLESNGEADVDAKIARLQAIADGRAEAEAVGSSNAPGDAVIATRGVEAVDPARTILDAQIEGSPTLKKAIPPRDDGTRADGQLLNDANAPIGDVPVPAGLVEQDVTAARDAVPYDKKVGTTPDPEEEPDVPVAELSPHDIDLPEEPEMVDVVIRIWDDVNSRYEVRRLGPQLLVPTGCQRPHRLSPYETTPEFKSALPRDAAADANLYAAYQTNGWRSRQWIMSKGIGGDEINVDEMDKQIADDVPFLMALQGKPDQSAGVAQTPGLPGIPGVGSPGAAPGSNNGAPLPPAPGPGRGNKNVPGDGLAKKPVATPPVPSNPSPGKGV